MRKIDTFFFGIGGVLLDYSKGRSGFHHKVAVATRLSMKKIEEVYFQAVERYWENLETGVVLPYQFYKNYLGVVQGLLPVKDWSRLGCQFTYAYFREAFGNVFVQKPKTIEFMSCLKKMGCIIILVSNNNGIHYEYCVRTAPHIFTSVDDCLLSHEVGYRKPDPAIWKIAQEMASVRGNTDSGRMFVVDDKKDNVKAAWDFFGIPGHVFETVTSLKNDLQNNYGFDFNK